MTVNNVRAYWAARLAALGSAVVPASVKEFWNAELAVVGVNDRVPVGPAVVAAGSTIADAAQLLEGFQVVTGADGTKGVKLPAAKKGKVCRLKGTAAAILKVYPQETTVVVINALAASGAMSLATGPTPATFICASDTGPWYSFPLVPS